MTSKRTREREEQEATERLQKGGNVDSDPNPNAETTNVESDLKAANLNDTERNDRNNADMNVAGDATVATGEKCQACNGTGAVVSELKDGRVEKWKNCPMCGAKGINPVRRNLPVGACDECNGTGKVPESFVNGKLISTKDCVKCKGTGTMGQNDTTTAVNTASNVPENSDDNPENKIEE